ncbi:MAG: histidine phosphatase family protein [Cytophagales bacterium]|nr:histidine phosphatase family protein [Cytophagales bacterium]
MAGKKIYLIRHGQTDFNLRGIVQGSGVDSSLNEKGRAQAHAFFEMYQHIAFDMIYVSTLKRTLQSVAGFVEKGIAYERLPGLNEISWGAKEGQPITPEEDAYYHWMLDQWRLGNTHERIEGGESPEEVAGRQAEALQLILSRENEEHVLICMHGRAIRILLCRLLNYPLRSMDMFEHENLCLYKLEQTGSTFTVRNYNDTSHLTRLVQAEKSASGLSVDCVQ